MFYYNAAIAVAKKKPSAMSVESNSHDNVKQEAQLMLTTGSTRLAVSRGQQT